MKGIKFADDKDVISMANGWLEQHVQQFFYNGEMLAKVHFSCRRLYSYVTKYHVCILLLTMSFYELFERPSYL